MKANTSSIPGLFSLEFTRHTDERGFFCAPFQIEELKQAIPDLDFQPLQLSHSRSKKGVLRGIHAEPWNKFIYLARGEIFGAYVDLRPDTFGEVVTLNVREGQGVFVPKGVGNSFQVVSDEADYLYLVDDLWKSGVQYPMLLWSDPDLAIEWPILPPNLSEKDKQSPFLADLKN